MFDRGVDRRRLLAALSAIAVVALLARFVALGERVFHWDEARVGYWTLRYLETGVWEYRPIVHGPLLFHVNKYLFGIVGASDAVARSFVALVGGLLPLGAWLFRNRLEDLEVIALALWLAANPVLLYYSRFMRNDVLVAGFALLAVGFVVRYLDAHHEWSLYAAAFALALAFGTKEIALVFVGVWIGALGLLLDRRLLVAGEVGADRLSLVSTLVRRVARGIWSARRTLAVAGFEFLLVIVFLYAPRPDLYRIVANPGMVPDVVYAATVGSARDLFGVWIKGGHEHSYVAYLLDAVRTTGVTSLPLVAFAVFGFLTERYSGDPPRDVVFFAFYWGGAIFLIYPAITDISAPWGIVHALVPLAIPAAVGIGVILDWGFEAREHGDSISVGLAAMIVLLVAGQVAVTGYVTAYREPQDDDNPLVQYGQPAGHLRPTLSDIRTLSRENAGTDVVFYGEHFAVESESVAMRYPASSDWLNRLPLAWYLERADARTASAMSPEQIDGNPPVVIARVKHYGELDDRLPGYVARTYELTASGTETVFFLDRSALNNTRT
ncbi:MAG: flippase activity-associated protein Agl23 [Halodesulfurarchaeum sp.]